MSSAIYVTLVTVGGTPVRLADQNGAPHATTGSGPLVFANGATLTNTTLSGATINNATLDNVTINIFSANTLILNGSVSGTTRLVAQSTAGGTLTLPSITDTLVGKTTTDTLTNKTFDTAASGNNLLINGSAATTNTGTGAVVRATSPTLVTPNLGTPTAIALTNATSLPSALIVSGLGFTPASLTGALVAGNVPVETATGIADSGFLLLTTLPANSVWGNNSSSPAAPAALTVLKLAGGTALAPAYSNITDPTSGIYFPSAGHTNITAGGKLIAQFDAPSGTNSLEFFASSTPTMRAVGGNSPLQLSGAGTGGVDLMTGGSATYIARFDASGGLVLGTAAIATNATAGFLYIPTCAGTPTGTPAANTGRVAMVFDTVNSQFWFFTGGTWKQPKTPAGASLVTWQ